MSSDAGEGRDQEEGCGQGEGKSNSAAGGSQGFSGEEVDGGGGTGIVGVSVADSGVVAGAEQDQDEIGAAAAGELLRVQGREGNDGARRQQPFPARRRRARRRWEEEGTGQPEPGRIS